MTQTQVIEVYFSHGKESGPNGTRITRLSKIAEEYGCKAISIDYQGISNPDLRVEKLKKILAESQTNNDFILCGSSMGGYVSLVTAEEYKPLGIFLLAPALYKQGYARQNYTTNIHPIEIIHGWDDDVIPPENSFKFAGSAKCNLHFVKGGHRLTESLDTIEVLFRNFLERLSES
jgi:predicted esterase